jgi:ribosomal protein L37AE/L43A
MRERQLSWAIDKEGKKVFIDDLKEEQLSGKFNCPHCFVEVFPKRGDKKVWHFSHKGEECEYVKKLDGKYKDDKSKVTTLSNYMEKTILLDNMQFEQSNDFTCALCRKEEHKDNGMEWSKRIWICRNCYLHMSKKDMETLEELAGKY